MHLSFVLAVISAFTLTVSMPVDDSKCPATCYSEECCPGHECKIEAIPVSMNSFHLTRDSPA
ncbi:hypothetical protein BDR03DRAFT_310372 [Suillus americanus]|nr:hypothetical protein BDR03DRAFT_310372 [Suillus americanus]